MSTARKKCAICQKSLTEDKKLEVILSCKHTFHRECAKRWLNDSKKSECPKCGQRDALAQAIKGGAMVDERQVNLNMLYLLFRTEQIERFHLVSIEKRKIFVIFRTSRTIIGLVRSVIVKIERRKINVKNVVAKGAPRHIREVMIVLMIRVLR